ncbi:MAG: hypothetical protein QOD72_782, partial [Acidimicrobiaceae bacterium]|nr:hypothetical protein [Acidimicrobiaceae bacterium]
MTSLGLWSAPGFIGAVTTASAAVSQSGSSVREPVSTATLAPAASQRIGGHAGAASLAGATYIVRAADRPGLLGLIGRLAGSGVRPLAQWDMAVDAVLVRLDASALEMVRKDMAVVSIEPDRSALASGSQASPSWGLDRIDQRAAPLDGTYSYDETGRGVTAYVIDSGLSLSHVDFAGRVTRQAYVDFGDGRRADDCNGHGTAVAGVVGGTTFGVAKGVSLVPVKVLDCSGAGTDSSLIAGIEWVIGDHQPGVPAVADISISTAASATLDAAVQALIDDGVTVVVAAGNDVQPSCGRSPARVAAAITVAASDRYDGRAAFSNVGSCNDVFAPGVDVVSAALGSDRATAV